MNVAQKVYERLSMLVSPADTVLDIGCGLLGPSGPVQCAAHVCVDVFRPALVRVKPRFPTILCDARDCGRLFLDDSYDAVFLLDIVEHLKKDDAVRLIEESCRVARRLVVVWTPDGFEEQGPECVAGLPENPHQAHLCGFDEEELRLLGFMVERMTNVNVSGEEIDALFAWRER